MVLVGYIPISNLGPCVNDRAIMFCTCISIKVSFLLVAQASETKSGSVRLFLRVCGELEIRMDPWSPPFLLGPTGDLADLSLGSLEVT